VITRDVTIVNPLGLHARPAAQVVKMATGFACSIEIEKDGMSINAKSIMGVMMLAAECGSVVRLKAEGADAEAAVEALATLFAAGFGES
jgi:phosphocarrier protein HPr